MKRLTRLALLFSTFVLVSACSGLAGEPDIIATLPPAATLAPTPAAFDLEQGANLFALNCTRCHGVDGRGRGELVLNGQVPAMPSFLDSAHMASQNLEDYYRIITHGNLQALMPPWKDALSDEQRWQVAHYVYTWHNDPERIVPNLASTDAQAPAPESTEAPSPALSLGDSFSLSGQVTNGTAGASVPEGLPVFLRYGNANDGLQTAQMALDADQRYRFEDIPYNPDYAYAVVAVYNDRNFASRVLSGADVQSALDLPITLYELTEDPFSLSLIALDIQIEPFQQTLTEELSDGLLFIQTLTYRNDSDRAFSLSRQVAQGIYPSLLIELPPGAVVLSQDPRFIIAQEQYAVIDTAPILPGLNSVQIAYFLPYSDGAVIDLPLNTPLKGEVRLTLAPKTLTVDESFSLIDNSPPFANVYSASLDLPIDGTVRFTLSGSASLAPAANTAVATESVLPVLLGVGFLVVVVVVIFVVVARRQSAPSLDQQVNILTRQIAELDTLHENGQLNHDAYQRQRNALKARLAQVLSQNQRTP